MDSILSVAGVSKIYASGVRALEPVDLEIRKGEIFALLGPNGAGKITVLGHDAITDFRAARRLIGLVPQELSVDMFETVLATVKYSRRLFGRSADDAHVEQVLRDLSLWDKRKAKIRELSGGMKRRVLIAKALSHEPDILFLDEPTAGVDVALRRDMWKLVHRLREKGTTIILTTHYIEEAEEMADRVGVIDKGRLILVEEKAELMKKLGKRQMSISLQEPMSAVPAELDEWHVELEDEGKRLRYVFDAQAERTGIPSLLRKLNELHIGFKDLETSKSSLEDIFVDLVEQDRQEKAA
jgi:ABC-2 type transport system ATP-binding protein